MVAGQPGQNGQRVPNLVAVVRSKRLAHAPTHHSLVLENPALARIRKQTIAILTHAQVNKMYHQSLHNKNKTVKS